MGPRVMQACDTAASGYHTAMSLMERRLGPISLADDSGEHHRLDSFWETRPAVLLFVRHFG